MAQVGRFGRRRTLLRSAAVALAWAAVGVAVAWIGVRWFVTNHGDDTFIALRYAERLARGHGLTWNDGYRVEGFSSPLWVLLLAAAVPLHESPLVAAKSLGVWCALACVPVAALGAWRMAGRPSAALVAAVSLAALTHPLGYWAPSGLETALATLVLTAATVAYGWSPTPLGRGRRAAFALAGAFALVRPEGLAVAATLVVLDAWTLAPVRPWADRARRREWLGAWALGVGPAAAWVLFRRAYFGAWLPNTAHAKMDSDDRYFRGFSYVRGLLLDHSELVVLLVALGVALAAARARGPLGRAGRMGSAGAAVTAALVASAVYMGGDWMPYWRLLVPATFAATLAACAASVHALGKGSRAAGLALATVFGGLWIPHGTTLGDWLRAWRGEHLAPTERLEGELVDAHRAVGAWLRERASPTDLTAVNHAGALSFYSGLPTLDMTGLNDRHVARNARGGLHEKFDADYVLACRPRFVVLNSHERPSKERRYAPGYWEGETAVYRHPDFERVYAFAGGPWGWRDKAKRKYTVVFERRADAEPTRPEALDGACWRPAT